MNCKRSRAVGGAAVLLAYLLIQTNRMPAQTVAVAGGASITLDEAIAQARANEPGFAAAVGQSKSAELDRSIARAALLPSDRKAHV